MKVTIEDINEWRVRNGMLPLLNRQQALAKRRNSGPKDETAKDSSSVIHTVEDMISSFERSPRKRDNRAFTYGTLSLYLGQEHAQHIVYEMLA
jgi:hypothetical protein